MFDKNVSIAFERLRCIGAKIQNFQAILFSGFILTIYNPNLVHIREVLTYCVNPANAGIHDFSLCLDSHLRGTDIFKVTCLFT